jgi:hypothetical protein
MKEVLFQKGQYLVYGLGGERASGKMVNPITTGVLEGRREEPCYRIRVYLCLAGPITW